eukprot:jgi/Bigna1/140819/aug1.58_g15527
MARKEPGAGRSALRLQRRGVRSLFRANAKKPLRCRFQRNLQIFILTLPVFLCLPFRIDKAKAVEARNDVSTAPTDAPPIGTMEEMVQIMPDWLKGFSTMKEEFDEIISGDSIIGKIPDDLNGVLYRNGPAIMETQSGKKLNQPFDGDGMVAKFDFSEGENSIRFSNKIILTKHLQETEGIDELGRLLSGDQPFAAHYRIMEESGEQVLINFGAGQKGLDLELKIWEFDKNMQPTKERVIERKKKAFAFLHDFVVTENYYVFHMNPLYLDLKKVASEFLLGKCPIAQCLKFNPLEKGTWLLVPRDASKDVYYDMINGKLTVDSVALDSFDFEANMDNVKASYFFNPGPMGRLHRTQIDLKTGKIAQSLVSERGCEFPSIPIKKTGVKHKYIYTACSAVSGRAGWGPNRAVMKSNLEDGSEELFVFGAKKFTGEPIFAPKTNANREDDGYLLVVVYDAEKNSSSLAIMDARNVRPLILTSNYHNTVGLQFSQLLHSSENEKNDLTIEKGPVAEIKLPARLPYGLHGSWVQP